LLSRLRRSGRGLARRVADLAGETADNQHCQVPEVLKLPELAQHDRMTKSQLGTAGVDPKLHPQRPVLLSSGQPALSQAVRWQDLRSSGREHLMGLTQVR